MNVNAQTNTYNNQDANRFAGLFVPDEEDEAEMLAQEAAAAAAATEAQAASPKKMTKEEMKAQEEEMEAQGFQSAKKTRKPRRQIQEFELENQTMRERLFFKTDGKSQIRILQETYPNTSFQIKGSKGKKQRLAVSSCDADELEEAAEAAEKVLNNVKFDMPRLDNPRTVTFFPQEGDQADRVRGPRFETVKRFQQEWKGKVLIRINKPENGRNRETGELTGYKVYPVVLTSHRDVTDEEEARFNLATVKKELNAIARDRRAPKFRPKLTKTQREAQRKKKLEEQQATRQQEQENMKALLLATEQQMKIMKNLLEKQAKKPQVHQVKSRPRDKPRVQKQRYQKKEEPQQEEEYVETSAWWIPTEMKNNKRVY